MNKNEEKIFIELIKNKNNIGIVSHNSPDGDCFGSQIALGYALKKVNKNITFFNEGPIPDFLSFMTSENNFLKREEMKNTPELLIFVDCAEPQRTGFTNLLSLENKETTVVNIDHHVSNTMFGDLNIIDANAAATAEIIYELILSLGISLDNRIASQLYYAISMDTGSFLYDNITAKTFAISSQLIAEGADIQKLRTEYYENISLSRVELLRYSLENLKFSKDKKLAWVYIADSINRKLGLTAEDSEGVINYLKSISGIEVALLIKELPDSSIKLSLRSRGDFDVNYYANSYGGGGHKKAAGCTITAPKKDTILNLVADLEKRIKK